MILDAMNLLSTNLLLNSPSMYLEGQSNGRALEGFQCSVDGLITKDKVSKGRIQVWCIPRTGCTSSDLKHSST